jgi:hypothetical protein
MKFWRNLSLATIFFSAIFTSLFYLMVVGSDMDTSHINVTIMFTTIFSIILGIILGVGFTIYWRDHLLLKILRKTPHINNRNILCPVCGKPAEKDVYLSIKNSAYGADNFTCNQCQYQGPIQLGFGLRRHVAKYGVKFLVGSWWHGSAIESLKYDGKVKVKDRIVRKFYQTT